MANLDAPDANSPAGNSSNVFVPWGIFMALRVGLIFMVHQGMDIKKGKFMVLYVGYLHEL